MLSFIIHTLPCSCIYSKITYFSPDLLSNSMNNYTMSIGHRFWTCWVINYHTLNSLFQNEQIFIEHFLLPLWNLEGYYIFYHTMKWFCAKRWKTHNLTYWYLQNCRHMNWKLTYLNMSSRVLEGAGLFPSNSCCRRPTLCVAVETGVIRPSFSLK